jgi:hypothetical protein
MIDSEIDKIIQMADKIHEKTKRVQGNYIILNDFYSILLNDKEAEWIDINNYQPFNERMN